MSSLEGANVQQTTESKSGTDEVQRSSLHWKKLHGSYFQYLVQTFRSITPDGDPITREWLDNEATAMADAQYRQELRTKNNAVSQEQEKLRRDEANIQKKYGFSLENYEALSPASKEVFLERIRTLSGVPEIKNIKDVLDGDFKEYYQAAFSPAILTEMGKI